ncbi:MAG: SDR family oxidoreductase [Deltaproteobacteria bacterium]|nr:SDR family oxidoreductase [Deltaproteobacteria bacterium]MBI4223734.1 SDR family oxidoreductase [Deltaproteobacteria bacterium]
MDQRFSLRGKAAVVVGGAGYLCSALSRAMLESEMKVAILDVVKEPPADLSGEVFFLQCDAAQKEALLKGREAVLQKFGRVDVLLNGATCNAPTPFLEISEPEIDRILRANVYATLYGCQVFGEAMVKQRKGSIINFASASSTTPLSRAFVYSAAKAGVLNLTKNLAREWAPYQVRVNALQPGFFPTEWSRKHFIDEERQAKILGHTPMRRFGKPEELTGAVLWLASEAASFVTGSVVTIDGGFTAMTI